MLRWVPFAMVRITLFLVGGILLAIYQPNVITEQTAFYLLLTSTVLYLITYFIFRSRSLKVLSGMIGLFCITLFGYLHLMNNTGSSERNHILHEKNPILAYEAIVRTAPELKARSWKVQVEIVKVKTDAWKEASGNVLIYVSKRSMEQIHWLYGDRLLIQGSPQEINPPANPNEFDFKRFLTFRNTYHQQFLQANQVRFIKSAQRKGFIYYSHRVRAWASQVIRQNIPGEQEQAIAMALVLGVTEGIDTDLQNAYAASGAMHVLAVSGLHVGILYGIILLLLQPVKSFARSRWIIALISILFLWSFAFVTGLSPSVLRAVTMFSFIALARPLGWRTNIYNTLAASAFVLLIYNPYLIMSVGFQLSYLAVMGIVYLQRPIYNLWEIDNRIGDWVWQITCVSIAAQISTFALSMLYFHQFPVYFLMSNLFVIPLSTLILVGGIALLIFSAWSSAAWLIGKILVGFIQLLNWLVFKTEDLPFSLVSGIYLTTFQCWLIILLLAFSIAMIQTRSIQWLYAAALIALTFVVTQVIHFRNVVDRKQFVVYSVSGHSAMEWIDRGVSYFNADSTLQHDEERIRFHIRPNRLQRGVSTIHTAVPFSKGIQGLEVYSWNNTKIAFAKNKDQQLPQSAEIDYLVVAKNSLPIPERLEDIPAKKIILDGSNSRRYINKWKRLAETDTDRLHAVLDEGAFTLTN
ncbi:MAG: ComEC family competence protein [Cyclobacteriaceae bacterium]|nr:ComEC family competence protein [Cyclobacteriaceae bacterium]